MYIFRPCSRLCSNTLSVVTLATLPIYKWQIHEGTMGKSALIPMFCLPLFLQAQTYTSADTLHVYGPRGHLGPINECAELFSQQTGHPVKVVAGPDTDWIYAARKNGNIFSMVPNTCSTRL